MKFELTILGSGAATPTLLRNPTSQYLYINERHFLIDCGEGTQMQLRKHKLKFQKINQIFISHLHGDHYLGLMGLLSSMHLLGRKKNMTLFGPVGLKEMIMLQLKLSKTYLSYHIDFVELTFDNKQIIWEDDLVEVSAFPLNHRIETFGYFFQEKERERNIIKAKLAEYKIPLAKIKDIKAGADLEMSDGRIIPNTELTSAPPKTKSYAYCSDTKYDEKIAMFSKGADLIYHEATFIEKHKDRAVKTFHSTAKEAGCIAKMAGAGKLLLGHFSARYANTLTHLEEATTEFEHVVCVEDGDVFKV